MVEGQKAHLSSPGALTSSPDGAASSPGARRSLDVAMQTSRAGDPAPDAGPPVRRNLIDDSQPPDQRKLPKMINRDLEKRDQLQSTYVVSLLFVIFFCQCLFLEF